MPDYSGVDYAEAPSIDAPLDARPLADFIFDAGVIIVGSATPPPDETAPVVTLVSPLDGRLGANEAVVLDVTDNLGDFARIMMCVRFPALGRTELAHDSVQFVDSFAASSSRVAISGGWRYTLQRTGGWPASPIARVFVTDGSGNNES